MVKPSIEDSSIKIEDKFYELIVGPKESKIILIKVSVEGFSSAARMSTSVFHGEKKLREMCLQANEKTQRGDSDIWCYQL